MVDFGAATVVGGIAGKIGGSGVNGRKLRGIYRRANDVIKTAKSARRIAKYVAKKTAIKVTVKSGVKQTVKAGFFQILRILLENCLQRAEYRRRV